MVALWQRRHSDVRANAENVYGFLALLVLIVVIGVFAQSQYFYIGFMILFIFLSW